MTHEFEPVQSDSEGLTGKQRFTLVVGLVLISSMAIFVVQNTESTEVEWTVFDPELPLWLVVVGSAVAGALIALIGLFFVKRRK
jgi:uncharacterized integral membrane protein